MTFLAVVLGGALGAPSRWLLDRWVTARRGGSFPWGTFVINSSGSLLLGLLLGAAAAGGPSALVVALVGTGFCGAFTTFSTFGFETVRLAEERAYGAAAANVVLSLGVGLALAAVGWSLGHALWT